MDGVPLVGTIDRLDFIGKDKVHIVDYKTGSTEDKKIKAPNKKEELGGLYWRQLVFYKILFELHQSTRIAGSAEISYLEPDSKKNYLQKAIDFSIEDVEFVKELIRSSYRKIMNHEFYEGCGDSGCVWCDFVKLNIPVQSFSDREAELLDD